MAPRQLRLAAPDGSGFRVLTNSTLPGINDRLPAWLPDSRTVIFERKTTTPGEQQAQQNHDGPPCGPSPLDAVHNSTLWRIDTHTLAQAPLFDASAPPAGFSQLMPTIAPDGKRLAFTSDRNASGVRDVGVRLWVVHRPTIAC